MLDVEPVFPALKDVNQHCSELCLILDYLAWFNSDSSVSTRAGENITLRDVSEWLRLAASVIKVEVDTTRFVTLSDQPDRLEYQSKRSELLGEFVTRLPRFTFIWGALEIII